ACFLPINPGPARKDRDLRRALPLKGRRLDSCPTDFVAAHPVQDKRNGGPAPAVLDLDAVGRKQWFAGHRASFVVNGGGRADDRRRRRTASSGFPVRPAPSG